MNYTINKFIAEGDRIVVAAIGASARHAAFKAGCNAIDGLPNDSNGERYILAVRLFVDKMQQEDVRLRTRNDIRNRGIDQDWPATPYVAIEKQVQP